MSAAKKRPSKKKTGIDVFGDILAKPLQGLGDITDSVSKVTDSLGNTIEKIPDIMDTHYEHTNAAAKAEEVRKLKELLDEGLISPTDYESRKNKILGLKAKVEKTDKGEQITRLLNHFQKDDSMEARLKISELKSYKELYDAGTIAEKQFEKEKAEILSIPYPKKMTDNQKMEAVNAYKSLFDEGVITKEEFENEQDEIFKLK